MLPDVGMVQMYSSQCMLMICMGFTGTGWSSSLRGPVLLLVPTFFRQVVCHALQRHTAPSLHLPLFLKETFLRTLVSRLLWNANCTWATVDLLERLPNNSGNKGMCSKCTAECVAHCGMWLGGQPRVVCGGWVQDVLLLFG